MFSIGTIINEVDGLVTVARREKKLAQRERESKAQTSQLTLLFPEKSNGCFRKNAMKALHADQQR